MKLKFRLLSGVLIFALVFPTSALASTGYDFSNQNIVDKIINEIRAFFCWDPNKEIEYWKQRNSGSSDYNTGSIHDDRDGNCTSISIKTSAEVWTNLYSYRGKWGAF